MTTFGDDEIDRTWGRFLSRRVMLPLSRAVKWRYPLDLFGHSAGPQATSLATGHRMPKAHPHHDRETDVTSSGRRPLPTTSQTHPARSNTLRPIGTA